MITPISNPSGWDLHPEDRDWIIKQAKQNDVILVADEAYNDAYRHMQITEQFIPLAIIVFQ